MEGIQETIGFINEVRRITREARDRSIVEEDKARRERLYKAQVMREEAEKVADDEWPDLQNAIRKVASDGDHELTWGIPAFSDREKDHYYRNRMMDILKQHGFLTKLEDTNRTILVSW